jgi:hypothetical protein
LGGAGGIIPKDCSGLTAKPLAPALQFFTTMLPVPKYLLVSEVMRITRLPRAVVKKHFPITRLGRGGRITQENFEATIRDRTFQQEVARFARALPLQKSFAEAAQELRAQGHSI